jgi:spore germination protein GerM
MLAVAAVLALPMAAAACGLDGSDQVEQVDSDRLVGLNEPTEPTTAASAVETTIESTTPDSSTATVPGSDLTTTTQPATTTTTETEPMQAYFIQGSGLVEVSVPVPEGARLRRRLHVLEEDLPDAYAEQGVRTALPSGLITGLELWQDDGITIHLDGEVFAAVDTEDHQLMIGQIVLTLTDQPGIDQVDFTLDGEPLAVYLRDNQLGEPGEAASEDDYEMLLEDETERTAASTTAATESSLSSVSLTDGP